MWNYMDDLDDLNDCHTAKPAKWVYQLFYIQVLFFMDLLESHSTDLKFNNASISLKTIDGNHEQGLLLGTINQLGPSPIKPSRVCIRLSPIHATQQRPSTIWLGWIKLSSANTVFLDTHCSMRNQRKSTAPWEILLLTESSTHHGC